MSIFTPPKLESRGGSKARADSLIDMVEGIAMKWPNKFGLASSTADIRDHFKAGRIALPLGMENGSPIEGKLSNLGYFHKRGVRYISLAHSEDNQLCDSSYDTRRTWGGLSPFGRRVVMEMNRLGIMIDVSHASDDAFFDIVELSSAPVIASHSSCRHFTPGFERNMSDDMIKKLAETGGVVQISFGSVFISDECRRRFFDGKDHAARYAIEHGLSKNSKAVKDFRKKYFEENPVGFASISEVADHIDHVVRLVGVEHVGLGSDFDGVGDSLPDGLKDVSGYPNLIYELLGRGYSEEALRKICGENLIRVWEDVELSARRLQDEGSSQ
jgi:membrane dipeptidase